MAALPPEAWLRLLSEPALVVDARGVVVAANAAFERLGGARAGQELPALVEEEHAGEPLGDLLRRWSRSPQPVPGALTLRTSGGLQRLSVQAGRLSAADDEALVLVRVIARPQPVQRFRALTEQVSALKREIEQRARAEALAHAERERFETTLASIGDGVITTDEHGRIAFMNPIAEALTGWPLADAIGRDHLQIFDIVNETTRLRVESPVVRVFKEGVIVGLANHTILLARDGTERPIDDSGAPIRDRTGRIIGAVLVFRDVSQRRAAEMALRESEVRFRTLADSSPVLIWSCDAKGACTYVNQQWRAFSGRPAEQDLGRGWLELVHPDDRVMNRTAFFAALARREPLVIEFRLRRADGAYRWMLAHALPRFEPDGTFAGLLSSGTDISERRSAEEQLVQMNRRLEERVAERTAQLRDLAARLTQAEHQERRRLAQALHDNLQQLLVTARLHVDRLDDRTEAAELRAITAPLRALILEAVEASRSLTVELSPPVLYDGGLRAALPWLARRMSQQQGFHVDVEAAADAEPLDDETRVALFAAARELLFNVVKHAGTNHARVTLKRAEHDGLHLVVEDQGAGFHAEVGQRTDGFGLFSLRERIQFLGGTMEVRSRPGEGTRVSVTVPHGTVPIARPEGAPRVRSSHAIAREAEEPPAAPEPLRLLLADDHPILREGIAHLLRQVPDVTVVGQASDGEEAVTLALALRPDVVVMDVTMPNASGIEATRRLRAEAPEIVVIGLSMHDSKDVRDAMMAAGAAAFVVKDGSTDALLDALRRHGRGA